MSSKLSEISYALQNPESTEDQMGAWADLLTYLEANPTDREAGDLFAKYQVLKTDWTKQVQSV